MNLKESFEENKNSKAKMKELWTINFYSDFSWLCFQLPLPCNFSFWFQIAYFDNPSHAPTSCEACILRATAETALGSAPLRDVYQRWTINSLASPKWTLPIKSSRTAGSSIHQHSVREKDSAQTHPSGGPRDNYTPCSGATQQDMKPSL